MEKQFRRNPSGTAIAILCALITGTLLAGGCNKTSQPPGATSTPTLIRLSLADLSISLDELQQYGGERFATASFSDLTKYPDYQEGMQNPWLLEGAEYERWNWLARRWQVMPEKLDGLLQVGLENQGVNFGYVALRFKHLAQEDIEAMLNFLTRQDKTRFKLFVTQDMLIILWTNPGIANQPSYLQALEDWLQGEFKLVETPIDYVRSSQDLIAHVDTTISQEFESLNYPQHCQEDVDCTGAPVAQTCLKCPGGKFVFHNLTCEVAPGITQTTGDQGLCWQTQNLSVSDGFYNGECISTMFCLLPFENQEVPTIAVEETQRYLPLWKQALMEKVGISQDYYRDHFYVHSVHVLDAGGKQTLYVHYYFKIDWLAILQDSMAAIRQGGAGSPSLEDTQVIGGFNFPFARPIESIISEEQLKSQLEQGCMPGMHYDLERNIRIEGGRITLEAYGVIDENANRCKMARVDLESGALQCDEIPCAIP